MYTSNYWNYKGENAISIARSCPDWYTGREYKKLAPKRWFFLAYKQGIIDSKQYSNHYYKEVLKPLDPKKIYEELGQDAVLLCWESPSEFCHRRLVARWLEHELGIKIPELEA
jgi:hypothetical protein